MKKVLVLLSFASLLLAGCTSEAGSEKSTTAKATTTTKVIANLGDSTTTTKVEGAVIIGDKTEEIQVTTTVTEDEKPGVETTTTVKVDAPKPEGNFSKSDGVIIFKSEKIKPNDDFSSIKSGLGEPDEEYSSPSCLYDGDDKTFIYGGVTVFTYPDGSKDKVLEVEVVSDDAQTPKGLKIGLSVDEVTEIYGNSGYDGYSCQYVDGGVTLYVDFEDGKVVCFGIMAD